MARITISLPSKTAALWKKRAASERRSVSSMLAFLIENDLREAGLLEAQKTHRVPAAEASALGELRALGVDPLPHLQAILADASTGPSDPENPAVAVRVA